MPSLLSNAIHDDESHFLHNDVRDDDVALMPFSSGTTGLPKGVELTHSNLTAQLSQIRFQVLHFHVYIHPNRCYKGQQKTYNCKLF